MLHECPQRDTLHHYAQYSVISIYRRHFHLCNSRKTPHNSSARCHSWVQIWPKCYHYDCCAAHIIISYMTAIYRESIVSNKNLVKLVDLKGTALYVIVYGAVKMVMKLWFTTLKWLVIGHIINGNRAFLFMQQSWRGHCSRELKWKWMYSINYWYLLPKSDDKSVHWLRQRHGTKICE